MSLVVLILRFNSLEGIFLFASNLQALYTPLLHVNQVLSLGFMVHCKLQPSVLKARQLLFARSRRRSPGK